MSDQPNPPDKVYFLKDLVSNPTFLKLRRGDKEISVRVPWEDFGGDAGGITLDPSTQSAEIAALREFVRGRRGGITEATAEEYEDSKKAGSEDGQRLASLRPSSLLQDLRADTASNDAVDRVPEGPKFKDPALRGLDVTPDKVASRTPKARKAAKALASKGTAEQP